MSSLKWIIPIVLVAVLIGAGVWAIYQAQTTTEGEVLMTNGFGSESTPSTTPSSSPHAMGTSAPNSQPATGSDQLEIKNAGIQLSSPIDGQKISSFVKVSGTANVTSQKIVAVVKDENSQEVGRGEALACIGLDACPFEINLDIQKPFTSTGTVDIFSPSTIDSSPTYLQTVRITF